MARKRGPNMGDQDRDIGSEDYKIAKLVEELEKDKFLIPTFQRDFVLL
jgi:hypothetical protein